jgi:regulator of RNase E activity RraA
MPGDILVVDNGGSKVSLWGSNISMSMTIAGLAGAVINGGARDTAELRIQGLPTFVRYTMRETCIARMELESIGSVINCGNVKVEPGDFIVADDDGILVVPRDVAEEAARLARGTLDSDKKGRRKYYEALGYEIDETVT